MKIVCISGKAQHGKDTTAKLLEETLEAQGNRVLIAHYGDLVKYVCKTFFGWDGKKDEKGRTLLQRVGTDKIRAVSPDYWVDFIVSILDIFCDEWDYVLIPDTRFPNEYEIYETYGMDAILLRVVRPNFVSPLTEEQQKHASETALDDYQYDARLIIPPCKVGDTVWVITGTTIKLCTVDRIHILGNGQMQIRAKYFVTDNIYLYPDMFGKTVFLTCAEAEAAIEARKGDKE